MAKRVFIGLGSNLGNSEQLIRQAIARIGERVGTVVATSSLYTTEPWGYESPNPFCNAVVAVETNLSPHEVLLTTQAIEQEQGSSIHRDSEGNYIDRALDLDLIEYEGVTSNTPSLILPHPRMHLREFVLTPLAEIAPDWQHPLIGETANEMLSKLKF